MAKLPSFGGGLSSPKMPRIKLANTTTKVGAVTMRFFGHTTQEQIDARMRNRLRAAGKVLKNHIKLGLSKSYYGSHTRSRKRKKGGGGGGGAGGASGTPTKTSRRRRRGRGTPSAPGEWPRKRTGHLRRSIQDVWNQMKPSSMVGTDVKYGGYLHFGTRKMLARPWMTLGIRAAWRDMVQVMKYGRVL